MSPIVLNIIGGELIGVLGLVSWVLGALIGGGKLRR